MPTRDGYAEGIPSWVDLASPDPEGSQAFYGALFGWEGVQAPEGDGAYTMFLKDGKTVAGMGALSEEQIAQGVPPAWSTYIAVDDLDASLAKASAAGATVIAPAMDVGDTGRLAFVTDPTGAAIGMWQAGTHRGAQLVNEPVLDCIHARPGPALADRVDVLDTHVPGLGDDRQEIGIGIVDGELVQLPGLL